MSSVSSGNQRPLTIDTTVLPTAPDLQFRENCSAAECRQEDKLSVILLTRHDNADIKPKN
jgi:hypothetical protein